MGYPRSNCEQLAQAFAKLPFGWRKHKSAKKKTKPKVVNKWPARFMAAPSKVHWWAVYEDYINSNEWRKRRRAALRYYGEFCTICRSTLTLQVHHKSYARVGSEPINHLTVLCKLCHQKQHPGKML